MRQSRFLYLGALEIGLAALLVWTFGPGAVTAGPVVPALALAGVLAVIAGSVAAVSLGSVTVTWRHLVGASYLVFAAMWPLQYGPAVLDGTASTSDLAFFATMTVGALTFAFFGLDIARGGPHFDVQSDVDRVIGR